MDLLGLWGSGHPLQPASQKKHGPYASAEGIRHLEGSIYVCWEHEYRHAVLEKGWDEDGDFQLFRPTQDPQSHASCRVQHAAYKHGCWRAGTRLSLERLQLPLTPSAHPPRD
ncbi:uncharacterized [Tachysurus ichikawai]